MGLFGNKCGYCRAKIGKGHEIKKDVKVLGYIGIRQKDFCCEGHVNAYEQEINEASKKSKHGGCCNAK